MARDDKGTPKGVRGPGGPPPAGRPAGSKPATRPAASAQGSSSAPAQSRRGALERISYPILVTMHRVPRWLVVILMATCLFLGLIQSGGLSWLGGILLLLVAAFLGWLVALSWPVIYPGSRILRVLVVAAIVGIAILKFLGRF